MTLGAVNALCLSHSDMPGFYYGDHFEMYRNIRSLCCIIGVNIVLVGPIIFHKQKETHKKMRSNSRAGDGKGEVVKVIKEFYKLPIIKDVTRDVMYTLIKINTAICYI